MKSELTYTILEQCDCNIISFLDTSTYIGDITSPILRIYPPDQTSYININYNQSAITLIRPENLKYSTLPSGLYRIVQSICPNNLTEVESCYLQVCIERDEIKKLACEDKNLEELSNMLFYLDIAQGIVSECPEKGLEILNIVRKTIAKLKVC